MAFGMPLVIGLKNAVGLRVNQDGEPVRVFLLFGLVQKSGFKFLL
jgi:hypothetical protein